MNFSLDASGSKLDPLLVIVHYIFFHNTFFSSFSFSFSLFFLFLFFLFSTLKYMKNARKNSEENEPQTFESSPS